MALHGPIKVGTKVVGYWSAQRVLPRVFNQTEPHEYDCSVEYNGKVVWQGVVEHVPAHGAVVLAAKVLSAVPSG